MHLIATVIKGKRMASRHLLYRVTPVLMLMLLSFHYLYHNPLQNKSATDPSEAPKSNQQPISSKYLFKPGSDGDLIVINITAMDNHLTSTPDEYLPPLATGPGHHNPATSLQLILEVSIKFSGQASTQLKHLEDFHNASNSTTSPIEAANTNFYCPRPPPNLKGSLSVDLQAPPSLEIISSLHPDLDIGGHHKPPGCKSRDKVAIIVPYRDREEHLRTFLHHIHPVLKRQMLEYNIFVIDQFDKEPFNRAMLFNVGFVEALKREKYDCFIFHDVDLLPENDHNLYNCPVQPRHLSAAVDRHNYTLKYNMLFGGVSALRTEHFKLVNGFSNVYWGWGAEDDDMANRIVYHGLNISRPLSHLAHYKSLTHKDQKKNKNRYKSLFSGKERFNTDGLSNLNYTVKGIILTRLFTLVRAKLIRVGDA